MFGLKKPSLSLRVAWGKILGFGVGITGFFSLPLFYPEADFLFRIGILFWYPTLGAIIGLSGVYTWHPVINMPIRWWWRGAVFGGFFNLLLLFFAHEEIEKIMIGFLGTTGIFTSPWWIVAEGIFFGFVMDWVLTKVAGEGPEIVESER